LRFAPAGPTAARHRRIHHRSNGRWWLVLTLAFSVWATACDKASHENIDKWLETSKGPGKLEDAMKNGDLDADLRAHAAQNLIRIGSEGEVFEYFEKASPETAQKILAKLAPRLWENARVDGAMTVPDRIQSTAKDALFFLRPQADDATRAQIDTYLIDWLTGGYYKGRAESGRARGEQILRAIGPTAGDEMIAAINAVVAAPPDDQGNPRAISDEILLGAAVTGSPEAVAKLLELGTSNVAAQRPKLLRQVVVMLERAYVDAEGFENADPAGLKPNLPTIVALAKDESRGDEIASMAINLIRAVGAPDCLAPLLEMISFPHSNDRYRWVAAQRALDCAQISGIVPVAEAFPPRGEYSRLSLDDSLWKRMNGMTPRAEVAVKARLLLASKSPVARVTGIEVLGKASDAATAAEDAATLRGLAGDKAALSGWWGDQSEVPKKQRKPVPTVGSRASEVAKSLEELAKAGQK
jgi:hypothetical protein